jgi:hypothetical protein
MISRGDLVDNTVLRIGGTTMSWSAFETALILLIAQLAIACEQRFDRSSCQEKHSEVVAGWQLTVTWQKQYQIGAPIMLYLTLTNKSEDVLWLERGLLGIQEDYQLRLELVDSSGQMVPRTKHGMELLKMGYAGGSPGRNVPMYRPSEGQVKELDLGKIFDLSTPGIYMLTVSAKVKHAGMRYVMRFTDEPPFKPPPITFEGEEPSPPKKKWWPYLEKDNDPRESVVVKDIEIVMVDREARPSQAAPEELAWIMRDKR